MDWFEKLTGFKEGDYTTTKGLLQAGDGLLQSKVNGRSYAIGEFSMPSLGELRCLPKRLRTGIAKVSVVHGDVREMHGMPEYSNALFQVASQFNMLEMTGPNITPEHGVTRYQYDYTQGPACAIAAGAATIYRNYFVSVRGQVGQTSRRQLNGISELGHQIAAALNKPITGLWKVQNGYVLGSKEGMAEVAKYLGDADTGTIDLLRCLLRVGTHLDVEVTDVPERKQVVSQALCSAIPIRYSSVPVALQAALSTLVLEAAYEATLLAAAVSGKRVVLLTLLGGGAFGNDDDWIVSSIRRAIQVVRGLDIDIRIVIHGVPKTHILQMISEFTQTKDQ